MEDDDEFGDLYTDVLRPFSSSLSSAPPQQQDAPAAPPSLRRPVDLNVDGNNNDDDDNEILYGASNRNAAALTLADSSSHRKNSIILSQKDSGGGARVSASMEVKLPQRDSVEGDLAVFGSGEVDKDVNFDIEEVEEEGGDTGGIGEGSGSIIPGLTVNEEDSRRQEAHVNGGDEDWEEDSDSEDDLQIVLNETHHGPMGTERGMVGDGVEDDDDEDGDPLVIVADGDPNQCLEDQDWGAAEDATAAGGAAGAEGERKEGGEQAAKGVAVVGPKIGYSGYHHPLHSQFKVSDDAIVNGVSFLGFSSLMRT